MTNIEISLVINGLDAIANLIVAEKAAQCLFWTEVLVAVLIIIPVASTIHFGLQA